MVIVNGLEEARAALLSGAQALVSQPFAGCYAGIGYYQAFISVLRHEFPEDDFTFTLCCGEDAAIAYEALRLGLSQIICNCEDAQFEQLEQFAELKNAMICRHYSASRNLPA